MSGKRTKALRREFRQITGRAAVTQVQKGVGMFYRSVFSKVLGKRTKEAVHHKTILGALNEFRRFKRSGKTADQITVERIAARHRRADHLAWVEANNLRIADGQKTA